MTSMRKNVWRIVLSYALVASLWIFFSDRLLPRLGSTPEALLEWSIFKGLTFVAVTACLLYFLINQLTTRLWKTGEAWKASERNFRTLFDKIIEGIIVADVETGNIVMGNPAMAAMLGYPIEELPRLNVKLIHPQEFQPTLAERFAMMRRGELPPRRVIPVLRRNGSVFFVEVSTNLIERNGRRHTISLFRDMTDIIQAQENLKSAKDAAETANRAKDQFIAVLSHELRTPLTPALATVAALKETMPEQARADLEVVRRNLELETRLIDDLLDITRITRGKIALRLERTDLHDAVRNAWDICKASATAKRLEVNLRLEAGHSIVLGDPPRLQQIFWNLLANAIKFTPEGGTITVRSSGTEHTVRVEITDTGIGINPAELARIFLPFEQGSRSVRYGGLGLGLSISRNIAELHHGSLVGFSGGPGKGSTFTVELPVMEPAEAPPQGAATSGTGKPLPRILLVEDHADTLQILARLLRRWGYDVHTASTVQAALQLARQETFDVLISDLALPDGSGREIMAEVKARYGMRGVALSGYGTEADAERSRAAGFGEHLVKPINFPELRACLDRLGADLER